MLTRFRPLLLLAVAMLAGALALPAHALQFNYSTRLTLTDCNDADEAGFQSGLTMLCYDLTAGREEIYNGSAWVAYQGGGAAITSITPGTGATNLGKARSSSAGATDTGFAPWAVRDDALSTVAEDEGEYTPLKATSTGGLWMSIATPLGDSAMDDTANAVVTKAYVTDNSQEQDSLDVDSAACTTTCPASFSVAVGSYGWSVVTVSIKNVGDGGGSTPTLDAIKVWCLAKDETLADTPPIKGGSTGVDATDFTVASGPIKWIRTGTSGALDATPDMPTLDEGKTLQFEMEVSCATLTIGLSASADNTAFNWDMNGR